MTNHIEELMKAAGVEEKTESYCKWECEKPALETSPICYDADCLFRKFRTFYPAFTPAKQLELIKLILKADNVDSLCQCYHKAAHMFIFECFMIYEFKNQVKFSSQSNHCYEQALADLILTLIGKNELNKSEVKRILEDE